MFIRLSAIPCCAILLFTSGCNSAQRERPEISKALTTRANALNSGDISRYLSVVSPTYSDKGKNTVRLKESLEHNFSEFGQLSYEPGTYAITVHGASAEAVANYRMKITVRGKEITLNGTEHLKLTKEPEGWKIIAGL